MNYFYFILIYELRSYYNGTKGGELIAPFKKLIERIVFDKDAHSAFAILNEQVF